MKYNEGSSCGSLGVLCSLAGNRQLHLRAMAERSPSFHLSYNARCRYLAIEAVCAPPKELASEPRNHRSVRHFLESGPSGNLPGQTGTGDGRFFGNAASLRSAYRRRTSIRWACTMFSQGDQAKTVNLPSCEATSASASFWSRTNCAAER